MSGTAAPKRRASRRGLRAWAWLAGGIAFASPLAGLATHPKPAVAAKAGRGDRPVVIVRKITRRVVIREPAEQPGVRYVYAGGGSTTSSAGSSTGGSGGSAPSTSTGGS